jgi:hypothetical protein
LGVIWFNIDDERFERGQWWERNVGREDRSADGGRVIAVQLTISASWDAET